MRLEGMMRGSHAARRTTTRLLRRTFGTLLRPAPANSPAQRNLPPEWAKFLVY